MSEPLGPQQLDQLFLTARSIQSFTPAEVPDAVLRRLHELTRNTPTGFNSQPARFVFVRTKEGKERLAPALSASNRAKMLGAPATAIVAYDTRFFERVHELFPSYDARPLFRDNPSLTAETGQRNATLQAAFLILAARALGLDVGPMSGFKGGEIDRVFFPDGDARTILVINLGYGDRSALKPRLPRLSFEETATLA
jgi:3-hydroxypropanoate dehydrogenase